MSFVSQEINMVVVVSEVVVLCLICYDCIILRGCNNRNYYVAVTVTSHIPQLPKLKLIALLSIYMLAERYNCDVIKMSQGCGGVIV